MEKQHPKISPEEAWESCYLLQEKWNDIEDKELADFMAVWRKTRSECLVHFAETLVGNDKSLAMHLNYINPALLKPMKGVMVESVEEDEQVQHDEPKSKEVLADDEPKYESSCDADKRESVRQVAQHLEALDVLTKAAAHKRVPFSERLIKKAHECLMKGLFTRHYGKNYDVIAGVYRDIDAATNGENYPDPSTIPKEMTKIVASYIKKSSGPHDPFELASWLHLKIVSLHPFRDGNGRISRLLWCYSLMRHGLPFPVTPFPGEDKAYEKYIDCIIADAKAKSTKNLHSLTVISIIQTWKLFLYELNKKREGKYTEFWEWLEKNTKIQLFS